MNITVSLNSHPSIAKLRALVSSSEVIMKIRKVESDGAIEAFIEREQEQYEAEQGVRCDYTPFCFVAEMDDEIVGALSGATFFSEIYIDELVVKREYRGNGLGSGLIHAVETNYAGQGYNNINCCTNEFQAVGFYEKCGFELEFVRKNSETPQLNKYFYIKHLD